MSDRRALISLTDVDCPMTIVVSACSSSFKESTVDDKFESEDSDCGGCAILHETTKQQA